MVETDRQTDRQTDRDRETDTDRHTEIWGVGGGGWEGERQTRVRQTDTER